MREALLPLPHIPNSLWLDAPEYKPEGLPVEPTGSFLLQRRQACHLHSCASE
jgi:hypothetical protein